MSTISSKCSFFMGTLEKSNFKGKHKKHKSLTLKNENYIKKDRCKIVALVSSGKQDP